MSNPNWNTKAKKKAKITNKRKPLPIRDLSDATRPIEETDDWLGFYNEGVQIANHTRKSL